MKYDAVIFDLFGTLVDNFSFQEHERVLSEMAATLSAPRHDFVRLWGATFNERATGIFATAAANIEHVCRVLQLPVAAEAIATAARIRLDYSQRALTPRPGSVETLARLKTAGYKTGLISDCSSEVPQLWSETSFAPLVDVPIFSCMVGLKKPDPRIYRLMCKQLAVKPQACLYVGDGSSRELTGASRVGMHGVLICVPYEDSYDAHRLDVDE
jgi:putative hydrolase of the HAD superfamily